MNSPINDLTWHSFAFRTSLNETIDGPNPFHVFDRRHNTGTAKLVTTLTIAPRSGGGFELLAEMRCSATLPGVLFVMRVELVRRGEKRPFWSDNVVEYSLSNNGESRDRIRRSFSEEEARNVERVNVAHYPAPWNETEVENAPGPIDIATGAKHVLIVPGLLGDLSTVKNVRSYLESESEVTAQIWNWTDLWEKPRVLQSQIDINNMTRVIGTRLAKRLREWSEHPNNVAEKIHVMAMSAGTNIITVACEAKDVAGDPMIQGFRGTRFFESVTYLSGALSVRHPLDDVAACSKSIYNYYSDEDDILTVAYPKVFGIFEINVKLSWPAIGRFGYWSDLGAFEHITSQLAWLDRDDRNGCAEKWNNNGRHLNPSCLAEDYFRKMIMPIVTQGQPPEPTGGCPDRWQRHLHPSYYQDQSQTSIVSQ